MNRLGNLLLVNRNVTRLGKLFESTTAAKPNIGELVKKNKVVVFMKGNPEAPKCGFSNAVVQVFRMHGVKYDSYDVLENESIRQGKFQSV